MSSEVISITTSKAVHKGVSSEAFQYWPIWRQRVFNILLLFSLSGYKGNKT